MQLHKTLLAQVRVKEKDRIDALTISAEEVFGEERMASVPGLVLEMIHERLIMGTDFGSERIDNENDTYYDAA